MLIIPYHCICLPAMCVQRTVHSERKKSRHNNTLNIIPLFAQSIFLPFVYSLQCAPPPVTPNCCSFDRSNSQL